MKTIIKNKNILTCRNGKVELNKIVFIDGSWEYNIKTPISNLGIYGSEQTWDATMKLYLEEINRYR